MSHKRVHHGVHEGRFTPATHARHDAVAACMYDTISQTDSTLVARQKRKTSTASYTLATHIKRCPGAVQEQPRSLVPQVHAPCTPFLARQAILRRRKQTMRLRPNASNALA